MQLERHSESIYPIQTSWRIDIQTSADEMYGSTKPSSCDCSSKNGDMFFLTLNPLVTPNLLNLGLKFKYVFLAFLGPVFFPRDTTRSCLNLYATCYILRTAYLLFLLVYDYDCDAMYSHLNVWICLD